ncbi:MAG: APH(6) family putative aminoglycoside O-phosphotransferase [Rhizobiales bacterium]|nr:APH(6) family putative aminoglycoside O-phosphotransferase [Hyphomicrobiales bacterium]
MFEEYLNQWRLKADGDPIITLGSRLLPVRLNGVPAMLKIATEDEEKFGGLLMEWWDGDGAARVLARDGDALLLERAEGTISLIEMAQSGRDDEASRIICQVVARLHAPRNRVRPELIPLKRWFQELEPAAAKHGGILTACATAARELLASPQDVVALHGDVHHGNILDFGPRGWLAIDPKGLIGERGFDYANLFCNPDLAHPAHPVATVPSRFLRRLEVVGKAAGLERKRLLQWILAWTGLSAAWFIGDGESAKRDFAVAELAAAELAQIAP